MRNKLLTFLETSEYKLADRNYILGEIVPLLEFRSGKIPQEKGVAVCCCEDNILHAGGLFYDSELFNNSTCDNDTTWEKGDVFEFIFPKNGNEDYYEFHATPNGKKLEYHIPSSRTIRETPHEKKVCNCSLTIKNSYKNNLWYSELIIPLISLGISNLNNCKCLFARQNYKLPNIKIEVTASRIFPTTIHAPEFWHNIVEIVTKAKFIATRNKEHLQVFKYTRRSSYNFSVVNLKTLKQFIQKRARQLLEWRYNQ